MTTLLEIDGLHVQFATADGVVHAVNGVDLCLAEGETLAVLGESGSGKSVTAHAVMGLLDTPPARIAAGTIRYRGQDLLAMPAEARRALRGPQLAMIFQDALSSLNPVFPVGWQIAEMFRVHRGMNRAQAQAAAVGLMERVAIPDARARARDYPHQFSGGMRQRIMIAMAISLDPAVLIADEPTTALDVTVQAQILRLLTELQAERKMALLLITHDLGVVADVADRIAVMYAGRVVETADVYDAFRQPAHAYTRALLDSVPRLDRRDQQLTAIAGSPPNLLHEPTNCVFHPRCRFAQDICRQQLPPMVPVAPGRQAACHLWQEVLDA